MYIAYEPEVLIHCAEDELTGVELCVKEQPDRFKTFIGRGWAGGHSFHSHHMVDAGRTLTICPFHQILGLALYLCFNEFLKSFEISL